MPSFLFEKGELTSMEPKITYIFINPSCLEQTKKLLDRHMAEVHHKSIDYNIYDVRIGSEKLLALSSADPYYHFGMDEHFMLRRKDVKCLTDYQSKGVGGISSVDSVIQIADILGISKENIALALARPEGRYGATQSSVLAAG